MFCLREWLIYLALLLLVLAALALPLLLYPSSGDENADLRQRLYLLEQKVVAMEKTMVKLGQDSGKSSTPLGRQRNPLQQLSVDEYLQRLHSLLSLTSEQQQRIGQILGHSAQYLKTSQAEHVADELASRELILAVLTPSQRQKYLQELQAQSYSF